MIQDIFILNCNHATHLSCLNTNEDHNFPTSFHGYISPHQMQCVKCDSRAMFTSELPAMMRVSYTHTIQNSNH